VVVVAVALGLVAGGCGRDEPTTLDRGRAQRAVAAAVARAVEPAVASASCPGDLPRGRGRTFACTVALGGGVGALRVTARQLDDEGRVAVTLRDRPLRNEDVAAELVGLLERGFHRSFQATCGPDGWHVRPVGRPFVCRARDKTSRRSVEVTVDAAGRLSFDLAD
jgi:hypothetical protein